VTAILADVLDLATLRAMLATLAAHPWEALDDVAPQLAATLEGWWYRLDSAHVHWCFLLSFLGFGGAT
jgi:hypothetical protein